MLVSAADSLALLLPPSSADQDCSVQSVGTETVTSCIGSEEPILRFPAARLQEQRDFCVGFSLLGLRSPFGDIRSVLCIHNRGPLLPG